jgi:pyruvate dehydrogenase E2 component (dihydrolipoamide acetyltransferase)
MDVSLRDVENFKPQQYLLLQHQLRPKAATPAPAAKVFVPAGEVLTEEIKNSQMRKIIAKRLAESLFTAPHYNLTIEDNG